MTLEEAQAGERHRRERTASQVRPPPSPSHPRRSRRSAPSTHVAAPGVEQVGVGVEPVHPRVAAEPRPLPAGEAAGGDDRELAGVPPRPSGRRARRAPARSPAPARRSRPRAAPRPRAGATSSTSPASHMRSTRTRDPVGEVGPVDPDVRRRVVLVVRRHRRPASTRCSSDDLERAHDAPAVRRLHPRGRRRVERRAAARAAPRRRRARARPRARPAAPGRCPGSAGRPAPPAGRARTRRPAPARPRGRAGRRPPRGTAAGRPRRSR